MNTFKCFLACLLIATGLVSYGQSYQYPVKPGTDQWKALNSTFEKIKVCQLPESVLKSISTKDLLLTCLNYPLLNNYTASNSPYEGLLNIVNTFNGLNEFVNRVDAHTVLFEYYDSEKVSDIENISDKGGYTFTLSAVELLLSHESIMSRFDQSQKKKVFKSFMLKHKEKEVYDEYFGFYGKMTTAFVASKYMNKLDEKSFARGEKQELFISRMLMTDLNVVDELIITANNYLKNLN